MPGYHRRLQKDPSAVSGERMRRTCFIHVGFGELRVAFALQEIDRVLRAAAVVPLAGAPDCVLGIVDIAGAPVRVYDMRILLELPPRPVQPADRMVVTRQPTRLAFMADEVFGVLDAESVEPVPSFSLRAAGVRGVARTAAGMLVVRDLQRFLALERAVLLQQHA
ncbi:MAG: chemotaxis protein CheW [Ramlibacter sp.]